MIMKRFVFDDSFCFEEFDDSFCVDASLGAIGWLKLIIGS